MRRQKFVFIEHDGQNALKLFAVVNGKQPSLLVTLSFHAGHMLCKVCDFHEPFQRRLKPGSLIKQFRLHDLHGEERNQAHHASAR